MRDQAGCLLSESQGKILSINKKSLTAICYGWTGLFAEIILHVDDGD